MAEDLGFDQTDDDGFDYADLEPYAAETEEQEAKVDDTVAQLAKNQQKLAAKMEAKERQDQRDKLLTEFYATADDTAKEFADVLVAGIGDPEKVKKMLDLASAKAATVAGTATAEQEEASDEAEVEAAFAAPVPRSRPEVVDEDKEILAAIEAGDSKAALQYWLKDSQVWDIIGNR